MLKVVLAFVLFAVSYSISQIPAGYTGSPYGGIARDLPGRIEFEHYDLGGVNVAWKWDNKWGSRPEDGEGPASYTTNSNPAEIDTWVDGGGLYPSEESPQSLYFGASHASDWVSWTVNVTQTGSYQVNTAWAAEGGDANFNIKVDGENVTGTVATAGTHGFHLWVANENMVALDLTEGLHHIAFTLESAHINCDYLEFLLDGQPINPSPVLNKGRNNGYGDLSLDGFDFGNQASILVSLADAGQVSLSFLDIQGGNVFAPQKKSVNAGSTRWDLPGLKLETGVYVMRLSSGAQIIQKKIVLH